MVRSVEIKQQGTQFMKSKLSLVSPCWPNEQWTTSEQL